MRDGATGPARTNKSWCPEITDDDIRATVEHMRRMVWIKKMELGIPEVNLAEYLLRCEAQERQV